MGSCAFARHYLRNHCCFLFLRVLRCFSSPGSPHALRDTVLSTVGCPIRKSVVDSGYLPLATAYRSLSRPSSPSRAKASFMCPFLLSFLDWIIFACLRSVAFLRRLGCKCFCVGIELYSVRLFDETDARSYVLILLICSCLRK